MRIGDIELRWLGHSGVLIKEEGKNIYIDPFKIPENSEKADVVFLTHSHYDHCSIEDLQKILKDGSIIVMPADCQSKITKIDKKVAMQIMEADDEISLNNIKIKAVPAYNIKKDFHSKAEGWLGYVIGMGNTIVYHAGDTDLIPEMEKLTGFSKKGNDFVALLPVGGEYTMDYEEAAKAAKLIQATITIPIHYGSIVGDKKGAEKFCELAEDGVSCRVLERE